MMPVASWTTTVYAHADVPIDNNNYPWFNNTGATQGWMDGFMVDSRTACSYQREGKYVCDYPANYETLQHCNYISWVNSNYGNMRFYGRITNMYWVNDGNCRITYETDGFLTFMGYFNLGECYVEREHVQNDWANWNVGINNEAPESFDFNDWVTVQEMHVDGGEQQVCLLASTDPSGTAVRPGVDFGVFNAGYTVVAPLGSASGVIGSEIEAFINTVLPWEASAAESIIGVTQTPLRVANATRANHTVSRPSTADGYTPENAKVLQYPYLMIEVSNNSGSVATYAFEDFENPNSATFSDIGSGPISPSWLMYPTGYRGMSDNYDEGLLITDFPLCLTSGDMFSQWWAQNKFSGAIKAAGSIASVAAGFAVGGGAGLALSGSAVGNIANSAATLQQKIATPDAAVTQAGGEYLNVFLGRQGFTIKVKTLKAEAAERLDGKFKAFGYNVGSTKIPNYEVRPVHNYVKTIGCTLKTARCPAWAVDQICNKFNNGITLWRNGENWGNYYMDNRG